MSVHHILVVDHDPAVHQQLAALLDRTQWRMRSAYDSATGLAFIHAAPYDVVLTEIRGPDGNGVDMLPKIRSLRPEAKVIVLASGGAQDDIVAALRDQAFGYFSKPFSASALADLIEQAVHESSWEDDIRVISAIPAWLTLQVRCRMEVADRLVQFIREKEADLPVSEREDIAGAFRELLMNAIEHGGRSDPSQRIEVTFIRTSGALMYYIRDPGEGFSFENLPHAAISNPPDSPVRHSEIRSEQGVRPGGFGILLTRRLVDELVYNEKGNEVLFIKYLK